MATITGFTAERMLVIENESVIDGEVVGNNLHLMQRGGAVIDAGNVRGPTGATGATGPPGTNGTNGTNGKDGLGVPAGGTVGQLLTKNSSTDNDSSWKGLVLPASVPRGLEGREFRGPPSNWGAGGGNYWTTPAMSVTAGRKYVMLHYFYIANGPVTANFYYITALDSQGILTGQRLWWVHVAVGGGGTCAGTIHWLWTPASTGNVTFSFGVNGPSAASPNIPANVCQMSLTDVGGV